MISRCLLLIAFASCVACSGGSGPTDVVAFETGAFQLPERFAPVVDHPYHPLAEGSRRTYEGTADGAARRDEVAVLSEKRLILGVECTAVLQEVFLNGAPAEISTEWFAQDEQGNLWRFGEESFEMVDGEFERTEDSWVAGENDARPWIMLGAVPQVGDLYVGFTPNGEEKFAITSIEAEGNVPAGVFFNCVQAQENPDDPKDSDLILYAASVGLISEHNADGQIELTAVR